MKKVSAIITTHNRKELLKKAIISVLNQTYKNIECIVVDDASDQNVSEYIHEYMDNIKYIYIDKSESKGGNYARNVGARNATGELLAFLDDDDEWIDDKIEKQVARIDSNNIEFVYCGMIRERDYKKRSYDDIENKKYLEGDLSIEVLVHIITNTSSMMVTKDLFWKVNGFDEELAFWQEYELSIRLLQETKVACVRKNLVLYRILTSDKTRLSNKIVGWENAVKYINEKHKDLFDKLNKFDKKRRDYYICLDGLQRAKQCKNYNFFIRYFGRLLRNSYFWKKIFSKIIPL